MCVATCQGHRFQGEGRRVFVSLDQASAPENDWIRERGLEIENGRGGSEEKIYECSVELQDLLSPWRFLSYQPQAFIPYQTRKSRSEAFEADYAMRIVRACYQSELMPRNDEET